MAEVTNKIITLDNLAPVIEKIKGDFATKEELKNLDISGSVTYATDDEVMALFEDSTESDEETTA